MLRRIAGGDASGSAASKGAALGTTCSPPSLTLSSKQWVFCALRIHAASTAWKAWARCDARPVDWRAESGPWPAAASFGWSPISSLGVSADAADIIQGE